MPGRAELLPLLKDISQRLNTDVSLDQLARLSGWSKFHLHRAFHAAMRETPKQYVERLRLARAAGRLAVDDAALFRVAADCGFSSQEVFTRAFRRQYGSTPAAYRARIRRQTQRMERVRHAELTAGTAPCVWLFHTSLSSTTRRITMPTLSIVKKDAAEQPVLFVRTKAARHEVANAIGEALGKVTQHVMKSGLTFAGQPYTRYLSSTPGLLDMEIGMPVGSAGKGEGDVQAGTLPSGPTAMGTHGGPYDQLGETYAAMERWIGANGMQPAGPPWEIYVTDPADYPDPGDWRTEVYWPVKN